MAEEPKSLTPEEKFLARLDGMDESEVRLNIATRRWNDSGNKKQLAQEWLDRRERERAEASNSESLETAKSARDAAWAAADAARDANRLAKRANKHANIANAIAVAAVAVAIASIAISVFG